MSVTSGFFNSLNGDRKYNAEQMSAIFNGIINDGVFANIGTAFAVNATTGLDLTVGIGRAWFNSAWLYNDTILPLEAEESELVLNRYDAVVIEINHTDAVRSGSIKIVKGTPASSPTYPTMVHQDRVDQYPLAYIYRAAGSTEITQANITNKVGTSDCPYITGILQTVNIDNIVAQWEGEWDVWSAQWSQWEAAWDQWFTEQSQNVDEETTAWLAEMQSGFDTWFNSLQVILDGDVATSLAASIVELQERFVILAEEQAVYEEIQDSSDETLLDSDGNPIEGRTVMGGSSTSGPSMDEITPEGIGAAKQIHASQHASEGSDPITPAMIGAYTQEECNQKFGIKLVTGALSMTGWSSKSQTIAVQGILADETKQKITVAPASASRAVYTDCLVQCTAQAADSLTFTCDEVPGSNLTVYITIEEVDFK